ncbi:hypothetical protein [Novosphingobium album (ex Liu et al. 2023)]|uniref:DUF2188 domain-containing protein n=1 Tax=Novosphingobium album (ex Liu et al. 2023) TaxID=3031130 RepID=A0ABT5WPC6_9SPHN|nr:hypothetical protein [Novosphingobium album (ex Liu et al. 2023)]MDE8651885.1 hypothetical protein [Novosphingobium album (ex Liu et al. 2023)]
MSELVKYKVVRSHWGEKIVDGEAVRYRYHKNHNRTADPAEVAHLAKRGILVVHPGKSDADGLSGQDETEAGGA